MSVRPANSVGITIAIPGKGVNNDFLDLFKKYLNSKWGPEMGFAIIENTKSGRPHLHAQLWYDKNRSIDDIRKTYSRMILKVWDESEIKMDIALVVKGAYSSDFYSTYLQKDIVETVFNKIDKQKLDGWEYSHKLRESADKTPAEIRFYQSLKKEDKETPFNISLALAKFAIENGCPRKDKLQNIMNYALLQTALEDENNYGKYHYWSKVVDLKGCDTSWN